MRFVLSLPLFAVGGLASLYGLFALIYGGDGGSMYVSLMGRHINAHLAGVGCLVLELAAVAVGLAFVRQRPIRS